jgi:hypothetical protein
MINKIFATFAGLVIASAVTIAQASASTLPIPSPSALQFNIGALFPGSGDARFVGGQTQLSAGLDYTLASTGSVVPTSTSAFFDYLSGARNSGYVRSGGLGLALQTRGPAYFGGGLGLYNTSVRTADGMSGNVTGGGGKVFAGFNLGGGSSVQLDYHLLPSSMGVNPSGMGLEIGFRL